MWGDGRDGRKRGHRRTWTRTYVLVDTRLGEELEELELAQRAQAEEGVLEGEHLLDRDLPVRGFVQGGDDGAVRAFAEAVEDLVIVACGAWTGITSVACLIDVCVRGRQTTAGYVPMWKGGRGFWALRVMVVVGT